MARELIGGAFISASIQLLVEKIASPEIFNYFLRRKNSDSDFEGLLEKLRMRASSLMAVLDDAEQRQIRDDPRVEAWLDGVQEAVFDAEDLLDEIAAETLRLGAEAAEPSPSRAKKRRKILGFGIFSRSDSNSEGTEARVRKVVERLEDIARQKEVLGLSEKSEMTAEVRRRLPSTSLVEESEVFGRDDDREAVIELLLEKNGGGERFRVVPVTGMGGIGKTTLAQTVFNDMRVSKNFSVRAWVHVSEDFDICRVTKLLLRSDLISDSDSSLPVSDSDEDLNSLQLRLRDKLKGKKFLFVLDDVWNEDYLDWDLLTTPFRSGAPGSRIIVTTRSTIVAGVVSGAVQGCHLAGLSGEACWSIFTKHASGSGDFVGNSVLERIGREIVAKCNGLPLAVKTLGGVLRSTRDIGDWERVSRSEIWDLKDVKRRILPALRLSYHFLPSHLKRCFAYCSIFPKDYRFNREELVLLWMAENLLVCPRRSAHRRMEDVGEEYFDELVSRSFLQRISGMPNGFVMHDLLVDLAKSVSKKYCFLSETGSGCLDEVLIKRARYFAYVPRQHECYNRFVSVLRASRLRTFLPVRSMFFYTLSKEVVGDMFSKLTRLRVLSFSNYKTATQFPESIGDLTHLRYLNLSSTSISSLPESTCALVNLQTLRLACCFRLAELPQNFHRLVSLRYLDLTSSGLKELPESLSLLSNLQTLKISRCRSLIKLPEEFHRLVNLRKLEVEDSALEGMPLQIRELKSIQTLSTFVVGENIGAKIGELGGFSDLRGTLYIKNIQNVEKPEDALEARLRDKMFLEGLRLEWKNKAAPSMHDREVLDCLLPNTNLKKLEFIYYSDTEFSNWLGLDSFCNIVDMSLLNCAHCLTLPPLGQLPSLRNLQIKGFDSVVRVGPEFYGNNSSMLKPFPSLEVLDIKQMRKWKEWSTSVRDSEAFPKLRKLSIEFCNILKGDLPVLLPSLTELTISECNRLVPSLPTMPNISKIELKMCQNLSRVMEPHVIHSFNCLQHLEISANSLSMRLKCLPTSLKTLKIQSYRTFEFQLLEISSSLEELSIDCGDEGSFEPGFTLGSFPNIKTLRMVGCQNLESLWTSSFEGLKSLSTLDIASCPDSTLFTKNTLQFPSLMSLTLRNCIRLKSVSQHLHNLAPSLDSMTIRGCSALDSLSDSGLPTSLRCLVISQCDDLVNARKKWDLRRLANLEELTIAECDSEDMDVFPEEGLLPTAITALSIWYLECLETLDNRELQRLTSLKQLTIYDCPNLQTMTDEALPLSLESLRINRCPLLEEKCRKEVGKYWDKISHIPWIYIDYKLVSQ